MTHVISQHARRRFILGRQGLWPDRRWRGTTGIDQALQEVETVQIDPVSGLAPSAGIKLWGCVEEYEPTALHTLLYEERRFFDCGGGLMIYPLRDLPYFRVAMARKALEPRWAEFHSEHTRLIDAVREEAEIRPRD